MKYITIKTYSLMRMDKLGLSNTFLLIPYQIAPFFWGQTIPSGPENNS